MNFDPFRLSIREVLARYGRVRIPSARAFLRAAAAETLPLRPEHGGLMGASGTEGTGHEHEELAQRRRRAATLAVIAQHLGLSSEANLDIEVVSLDGRLQFVIRDVDEDVTVMLDEADADRIVEKMRAVTGSLIDRAI
jgi:hypothetical protein